MHTLGITHSMTEARCSAWVMDWIFEDALLDSWQRKEIFLYSFLRVSRGALS